MIKNGDKFLCKKDYIMDNGELAYKKGCVYEAPEDNQLKSLFDTNHEMGFDDEFYQHFTPLQETQTGTPKHYATDSIDVIDFCKLYKLDFNRGNVIKYICRAGKKDNELEDLKKALTYLEREIKYFTK